MTTNVHCLIPPAGDRQWNHDNQRLAIQSDIALQAKLRRTAMLTKAFAASVCGSASLLWLGSAWAAPPADPSSIWTLQDENASISVAKLTDRYYVNGLSLGWTSPTDQVPGLMAALGNALWGDGQRRIGFSLSQQMYTPASTQLVIPDPRDRPYAGVLLGNISLLSDTDRSRSVLMLSIGLAGPGAGAKDLQNGFHSLIGQPTVKGWNSQIPNTSAVELLSGRTWRLNIAESGALETDVLPSLTAAVGDVRNYAQVGVTFRIGQGLNSDFGVSRLRPGLSGVDAYMQTRSFAWYVFGGVDGQVVAYDLLLQAGPFRSGPHVDPVWDVGEAQAGFAILVHGMRFSFTYAMQTLEFQGQHGGLHQFGSAALSVKF
jgi:lipid A 3-O-deacylase